MKRLLVVLLAACSGLDQPVEVGEVESAGTSYQGTSYQGTSYQGTSYQGTSYQGTSYQGTSYQGASYGGTTLSSAQVNGTAISTWRLLPNVTWEQRLPDRVCTWNLQKTSHTCTVYNLATQASPLGGTAFAASFTKPDGTTVAGTVQIASMVGAVRTDDSVAMFALTGAGATGAVQPCSNPAGCRVNSDLWLYDLKLVDGATTVGFCPPGTVAFALSGTWDATGKHVASTSQFTFACTTGTIAKCTRWGYRPWASAYQSDDTTLASLADYHQACVRAATADYCANGHSFTKNGTIVDVYDYTGAGPGFVPRTDGTVYATSAITALAWESTFDRDGALWIDHARYPELASVTGPGGVEAACPGRFFTPSNDVLPYARHDNGSNPHVSIDSTPSCAHAESTLGKWLSGECSDCTRHAPSHCTDPTDPRGWDQSCIDAENASPYCTASTRMTSHGECVTGGPLRLYGSGCTLALCSDPAYASCCSGAWTSACVAAANARCSGGREHATLATTYGFCNTVYSTVVNAP